MPSQRKKGHAGVVLGIETATSRGSVALCADGELLGELLLTNPRSHSERLLPSIDVLLKSSAVASSDLAAVAVSTGPGSFTGLRIGVAAAKGLAFSHGIPLFGLPSLEILAANASPGAGTVCAVIDARREEVFSALFRSTPGGSVRLREEKISTPAELASELPRKTLVLGELPPALENLLRMRGEGDIRIGPAHQNFPRAAVVALRGEDLFAEGRRSETDSLVPFYLRPSDAEANRAAGKRKVRRSRAPGKRGEKAC